jgi:hypothetical protein
MGRSSPVRWILLRVRTDNKWNVQQIKNDSGQSDPLSDGQVE